jgi:acyltransferase
MSSSTRIGGIDLVRVLGACAVIFAHVYTQPLTHQWVYPWNVSLFFVLSGYFWSANRSFLADLRNRVRTLAVPYLAWFVVIAVLAMLLPNRAGGLSLASLSGPAYGGDHALQPFGTLWFVSTLFFAALFYRLLEKLPWSVQAALGVVLLVIGYLFGPQLAGTPLAIGQAIPCVVFLMAGRGLRRIEGRIPNPVPVAIGLLVVAALTIALVPMTPPDLKNGLWGTPVIEFALAVVIPSCFILIAKRIPLGQPLSALVTQLSSVAIAVVLSHTLVIWELGVDGVQPKFILLAAVVIPWLVALGLRRTPLSRLFLGVDSLPLRPAMAPRAGEAGAAAG